MSNTNVKNNKVPVFNMLKTLMVIKEDKTLTDMVNKKFNASIPMMMTLHKNNALTSDASEYIEGLFEKVILKRKEYRDAYTKIKKVEEPRVPRRYGKEKIMADIANNGGRPTELQRAMLSLNGMRNIYAKLLRICINDYHGVSNVLTTDDCRDICAVVETLEKKAKKVTKNK